MARRLPRQEIAKYLYWKVRDSVMNNEDEKHDMDIEDDDGVDGAVVTESDEDEVLDMVR